MEMEFACLSQLFMPNRKRGKGRVIPEYLFRFARFPLPHFPIREDSQRFGSSGKGDSHFVEKREVQDVFSGTGAEREDTHRGEQVPRARFALSSSPGNESGV